MLISWQMKSWFRIIYIQQLLIFFLASLALFSSGFPRDHFNLSSWVQIKPVNPKGNQPWIFIGRTDAEAEAPILWPPDGKSQLIRKDPDARKDQRQKEKGDGRGWDGWMASPPQWTWIWANSGRKWRTEEPGMLQCMGSQRVRHDLVTKQKWLF